MKNLLKKIMEWAPGMRTLKSALAVLICLVICREQQIDLVFYAVIAAVISMDKNIWLSFHAGKSRLTGTVIGAVLGGLCAFYLPPEPWVSACGLAVLIWILARLKLNASIVIASIVFLAVMVGFGNEDPIHYSVMRLADTLLGVVAAWLVNVLVFPYNNYPKIRKHLEGLLTMFAEASVSPDAVRKRIATLRAEIEIYEKQFSWRKKHLSPEFSKQLLSVLDSLSCEVHVSESFGDGTPEAVMGFHQAYGRKLRDEFKAMCSSLNLG